MQNARAKIVHVTTAHPRHDIRVRHKIAKSIAKHFEAEVFLIVQDGLPNEKDGLLSIRSAGPKSSRQRYRLMFGVWRAFFLVLRSRPDLVHFHDPELIPPCVLLKLFGIKVIYDVHEDTPQQILVKRNIPKYLRKCLSWLVRKIEKKSSMIFDGIVVATPTIARNFPGPKTIQVFNYPLIREFSRPSLNAKGFSEKPYFAYVGGIIRMKGAIEMIEAITKFDGDVTLKMAGEIKDQTLLDEVSKHPGWQHVEMMGWLERDAVVKILREAIGGLVLLHPVQTYIDSLPIKMFEYMAAGIPIIASNFELWEEILGSSDTGICVDPMDPNAIFMAMKELMVNTDRRAQMGQNGITATGQGFNWKTQEKILIDYYSRLGFISRHIDVSPTSNFNV